VKYKITNFNPFSTIGVILISIQKRKTFKTLIDHLKVVCSVTWPLDVGEAGVDLVLVQTSLLLLCKTSCSDAN